VEKLRLKSIFKGLSIKGLVEKSEAVMDYQRLELKTRGWRAESDARVENTVNG
jgi:hypothetical protein